MRFHQELDKRIEVFIKAIDRRFAIINGTAQPAAKKLVKDEPEWGEVPKGTRTELLGDIAGILDEAITNIDDVSRRDEKNPLISRSLRKLTASANGYLTQLAALRNQTKDPDEVAAIERVADNANQIIEVGNKLPPPAPEPDKKKKKPKTERRERQKAVSRNALRSSKTIPPAEFCLATPTFSPRFRTSASSLLQNFSRALNRLGDTIRRFTGISGAAIFDRLPQVRKRQRRISRIKTRRVNLMLEPGAAIQTTIIDQGALSLHQRVVDSSQSGD